MKLRTDPKQMEIQGGSRQGAVIESAWNQKAGGSPVHPPPGISITSQPVRAACPRRQPERDKYHA
jgi:hypothetical protein